MRRGTILLIAAMTVMLHWLPGGCARGDQHQEDDPASSARTRPSDRTELDRIRNGKIAFAQEGEMPSALEQALENPDEPILVSEPDIWTVNPNGSNLMQLTVNARDWDDAPDWSPDGEQIAFVKTDPVADQPDLDEKLYVMDADGSNKVELPLPKGVGAYEPTWSPDGDRIAFWDPTYGALYITHVDGSGMPKKLSTPGLPDSAARPVWSPNDREIAFQGINEEDSWSDIYIAKISPEGDMSELRQLTDHPAEEVEPSWSPDGTEIAFSTNRADGGGIYKININSLKETRLTHSPLYDAEPTWSPNGEQIAYVKQKLVRSTHSSIYKMHSDGSNSTPVFEAKGVYADHPDWGLRPGGS